MPRLRLIVPTIPAVGDDEKLYTAPNAVLTVYNANDPALVVNWNASPAVLTTPGAALALHTALTAGSAATTVVLDATSQAPARWIDEVDITGDTLVISIVWTIPAGRQNAGAERRDVIAVPVPQPAGKLSVVERAAGQALDIGRANRYPSSNAPVPMGVANSNPTTARTEIDTGGAQAKARRTGTDWLFEPLSSSSASLVVDMQGHTVTMPIGTIEAEPRTRFDIPILPAAGRTIASARIRIRPTETGTVLFEQTLTDGTVSARLIGVGLLYYEVLVTFDDASTLGFVFARAGRYTGHKYNRVHVGNPVRAFNNVANYPMQAQRVILCFRALRGGVLVPQATPPAGLSPASGSGFLSWWRSDNGSGYSAGDGGTYQGTLVKMEKGFPGKVIAKTNLISPGVSTDYNLSIRNLTGWDRRGRTEPGEIYGMMLENVHADPANNWQSLNGPMDNVPETARAYDAEGHIVLREINKGVWVETNNYAVINALFGVLYEELSGATYPPSDGSPFIYGDLNSDIHTVSGANRVAEYFEPNLGRDTMVDSLTAAIGRISGNDPLTVEVEQDGAVIESLSVEAAEIPLATNPWVNTDDDVENAPWYTFGFDVFNRMRDGSEYRVIFSCPATSEYRIPKAVREPLYSGTGRNGIYNRQWTQFSTGATWEDVVSGGNVRRSASSLTLNGDRYETPDGVIHHFLADGANQVATAMEANSYEAGVTLSAPPVVRRGVYSILHNDNTSTTYREANGAWAAVVNGGGAAASGATVYERQTVTIVGGAITINQTATIIQVGSEGAAGTDDLDTINATPLVDGRVILLEALDSAQDITYTHAVGNIRFGGLGAQTPVNIIGKIPMVWDEAAGFWEPRAAPSI